MMKIGGYQLFFIKSLLFLVCAGMVWAELDEIINDRELGIVRRQVPSLLVANVSVDTAAVGTSLFSGDTLRTDVDGFAMILFVDESVTRMRPESQLIIRGQVNRDGSTSSRIDVETGEIFMNVNRDAGSNVEVGTANSVAAVRGTTFGAQSNGFFWVQDGELEVTALESGLTVNITDGMFARVDDEGEEIETGEISEEEQQEYSSEYSILDSDLIERTMRLRFRDANGQLREYELNYVEQENVQ